MKHILLPITLLLSLLLITSCNSSQGNMAENTSADTTTADTGAVDTTVSDETGAVTDEIVEPKESDTEASSETETQASPDGIVRVDSLKDYFFDTSNLVEIDFAGNQEPGAEPSPPDGLISWELIPKADNAKYMNQLYSIRLTPEKSFDEYGNFCGMSYCHYIDSRTGKENLLIYLDSPTYTDRLLIFDTSFGSTEQFRQAVEGGTFFTAGLTQCENGNMVLGSVEGVGYIGNIFSDLNRVDELKGAYPDSVVISAGYLDSQTGKLTFDVIDPQNVTLQNFAQFARTYGIIMEPAAQVK